MQRKKLLCSVQNGAEQRNSQHRLRSRRLHTERYCLAVSLYRSSIGRTGQAHIRPRTQRGYDYELLSCVCAVAEAIANSCGSEARGPCWRLQRRTSVAHGRGHGIRTWPRCALAGVVRPRCALAGVAQRTSVIATASMASARWEERAIAAPVRATAAPGREKRAMPCNSSRKFRASRVLLCLLTRYW